MRVEDFKAGTIFCWFIWTSLAFAAPIPYACQVPPELSALASVARDAENSGGWQKLEDLSKQAVNVCPLDGAGYRWLGLSYLRRGVTFAAVPAFRASLMHSDGAGTHLRLAEAYFVLNQH